MKIISVINPKGGSAKTVSSVNICYALIKYGFRVLLIDSDPRGNIETYLEIRNENTLFELIKEQYELFFINDLQKYIKQRNGLDIITSSSSLAKIDRYFKEDVESELDSISDIKYLFKDYDFVVFDTEGTVNLLTKAILKVTDYIFTPTQASNIDINGIKDLINIFEISKRKNPNLELKKIFIVRAKKNTNAYKNFSTQLKNYFHEDQFSNICIREDQNIVNSMSLKSDIFNYKASSNAAIDYQNLVIEFLNSLNLNIERSNL